MSSAAELHQRLASETNAPDSGPDPGADTRTDPHPELRSLTVAAIAPARADGRTPNRPSGRAYHSAKAHGMTAGPGSLRLLLRLETAGDGIFRQPGRFPGDRLAETAGRSSGSRDHLDFAGTGGRVLCQNCRRRDQKRYENRGNGLHVEISSRLRGRAAQLAESPDASDLSCAIANRFGSPGGPGWALDSDGRYRFFLLSSARERSCFTLRSTMRLMSA